MSTALQPYLEQRADKLAQWAGESIDPRSLVRFALLQYSQNKKLQECSNESIYLSLIAAAQLGLEPGGVTAEAHIVPYGRVAQLLPGYKGLIKLALESGHVSSVSSYVVYEKDEFRAFLGTTPRIDHVVAIHDRGPMVAAYAVARISTTGAAVFEILSIEDIKRIQGKAQGSTAWEEWPEQMARKSAIKRLCKTLPLGSTFARAAKLDDLHAGDIKAYAEVIDAETGEVLEANSGGTAALKERLR